MEDADRNGTFDFRSSASAKRAGPLKSPVLYQKVDVFPEYTFNKIDRKVLRFNKFKDQAIELEYIHIDGQVDPKVVSKKQIINFVNSPTRIEFENFIINIIDVSSNYVKYSVEGI
ncbi:hypothetical protein L288_09890 [Sphingobium quisquiliarum P25]|uniref:Uncharacterized protein n=2 Tax=Sphingobium quisquiliarum TaxID=538379 RepID=T0H388_9SPHN|nr:hypothetical protein L288_09890 [Sphingobium quisquiliarum P25]